METDFIIGKKSSGYENLITLTERTTRMMFVKKISSKNAMKCNSILYKMIKENNLIVKCITIDNGIEFEKIGILANWIKAEIYISVNLTHLIKEEQMKTQMEWLEGFIKREQVSLRLVTLR